MPRKQAYASDFIPNFGVPYPTFTRAELETWPEKQLRDYEEAKKYAEQQAEINPVGGGWILPSWQEVMDNWGRYSTHCILGGNRCVRGDTLIYDPVLRIHRRIDSIKGPHHVWAFDGSKLVVAEAEQPFTKGLDRMIRVTLSTGSSFVAAPAHRVLSTHGLWLPVEQLRLGCALLLPRTTSGISPSDREPDAPHCSETRSSFPDGYRPESRLCDESLHWVLDNAPDVFPSPSDAPKHTCLSASIGPGIFSLDSHSHEHTSDARGNIALCTHDGSRYVPRSTQGGLLRHEGRFAGTQSHASYTPCRSASGSHEGPATSPDDRLSLAGYHPQQSSFESVQLDKRYDYESAYVVGLSEEGIDVKWDLTVPTHQNYVSEGVIHHNSTKSTLASRIAVWCGCMIPEAEIVAYHVNEDRSIEQQRLVWEAIPNSIKNLPTKKGQNHSISYSQKNGFTDSVVIFPPLKGYRRGGTISFKSYKQYQQDAQTAEGWKAHVIWCDEELPQKLYETLLYRIVDYKGRILLTFTTLNGWTATVQDLIGKTKTIRKRYAPLVKKELPVFEESLTRSSTAIYYFWTQDNAFIDTSDFADQIKNRPKEEILSRAYGVPTKAIGNAFPMFDKQINVIPRTELPWVKDPSYRVTRYMAIDPAGSKNWFMLWAAVDADGVLWIYREWPDIAVGEWAVPGPTAEGKPGPGQKGSGRGIRDYIELIADLEKGEEIYERFIDPRMGAAEKPTADGATSIISELTDLDFMVIPAPGLEIDHGLQLINGYLSWDERKPRGATNSPHLFISEDCQNTIYALMEYTARGGKEEAAKDPIDALRYIAVSNPEFYELPKQVNTNNRTGVY